MGLNNLDDSKERIEKYLKRNPTTCFVAEDRETMIHVILCGHDGRRGFIYHTTVHSDYRKQGIAKELVQSAIQALEVEGVIVEKIYLEDPMDEESAKHWEKMKVIDEAKVNKYKVLFFKDELPSNSYNMLRIDGIIYKPIITYDLPKAVAVESEESFQGKEVEFIKI